MSALALATIDKRIALIHTGRQALAEAKSLPEAKQIRDQAAAIEYFLAQQHGANDAAIIAAELKLMAERKLGEMLKVGERRGGNVHGGSSRPLPEGVTHAQSHRWQKVASVPESKFSKHIERAKADKDRGDLTTAAVLRLAKTETRERKRKENGKLSETCTVAKLEKLVASGQRFGTIYADPPWKYGNQATRAATDNHYPTMDVADICKLPIGELAAANSQLHLWTTNGFLFECPRIFAAWGFEFRSAFIWCKQELGIGNYWRVSHEYLLTAVRGSATFDDKSLKSWGVLPRGEHSAKPERVRKMIEAAGIGPRLELFGRRPAEGWIVWGNQISHDMYDGDVRAL